MENKKTLPDTAENITSFIQERPLIELYCKVGSVHWYMSFNAAHYKLQNLSHHIVHPSAF